MFEHDNQFASMIVWLLAWTDDNADYEVIFDSKLVAKS